MLPERDITRAEAETFWAKDRARLAKCFDNFEALWAYVVKLDQELQAAQIN